MLYDARFIARMRVCLRSLPAMRLPNRRKQNLVPESSIRLACVAACACLLIGAAQAVPLLQRSELPAPAHQINHGPAIAEIGDDLIACWYSGTTEANPDAQILCSRSHDQGANWTPPSVVVAAGERAAGIKAKNKSVGNVTLFVDARSRLWMIYATIRARPFAGIGNLCMGWRCGRVEAKLSEDGGRNWTPAFAFDARDGALARSKPVSLADGNIVVPLYLEGAHKSYLMIADLTHSAPGTLVLGQPRFLKGPPLIQPSLIQWNNKLRAYLRDPARSSVWTATVDPTTATWTGAQATNLPNPNAAIDAFTDDAGRVVLIYNPSRRDRHTLRLASSLDGVRFQPGCDLAPKRTEGDVAYPYVIRSRDASWHVVYSAEAKRQIEHVRFDEVWLDACLNAHS